jgi:hypothetical protein
MLDIFALIRQGEHEIIQLAFLSSMTTSKKKVSLESIAFQGTAFFDALTEQFGKWREAARRNYSGETGDPQVHLMAEASALSSVIAQHTGLNIGFVMPADGTAGLAAGIYWPYIRNGHLFDVAHGLYTAASRQGRDLEGLFKKHKGGFLKGSVDMRENRVSGFFSEVPFQMYIRTSFILNNDFSNQELAAIVLHEVGHAFTLCEYINRTVLTNQVLADVAQAKTSKQPDHLKLVLLRAASTQHLSPAQKDVLLKAKDLKETVVCAYAIAEEQSRMELGYSVYDLTSCEQLADQYVSRCGASRPLTMALSKFWNAHWEEDTRFKRLARGSFSLAFTLAGAGILGALFGPLGAVITTLGVGYLATAEGLSTAKAALVDSYDDPASRLRRVRNDLVNHLKDTALDRAQLQSTLADLEEIDRLTEKAEEAYPDKTANLWHYAALFFSGVYRQHFDMEQLQKQLETLANNNLFVQAAKLKTL